jgi:hypothetical protein
MSKVTWFVWGGRLLRRWLGSAVLWACIAAACGSERDPLPASTVATGTTTINGVPQGCVCPLVADLSLALPAAAAGQSLAVDASSCAASHDARDNQVIVSAWGGSGRACQVTAASPGGGPIYAATVIFEYAGRHCGWHVSNVATSFGQLPNQCNGSVIIETDVPLPADAAGSVVDLTADACDAVYRAETNSVAVASLGWGSVCTIIVSLNDGRAFSSQASFDDFVPGDCGGYLFATNPPPISPFTPLPGGAPACSR